MYSFFSRAGASICFLFDVGGPQTFVVQLACHSAAQRSHSRHSLTSLSGPFLALRSNRINALAAIDNTCPIGLRNGAPPPVWVLALLVLSRSCGVRGVGLLCRGFLLRLLSLLPPVLFYPPPPGPAVLLSLPLPVCHPSAPVPSWPPLVVLLSLPSGGMGRIPRMSPVLYPPFVIRPSLVTVVRYPSVATPTIPVLEVCRAGMPLSLFVSCYAGAGLLPSSLLHSALVHPPAGLLRACAPSFIACCCRIVEPACRCADVQWPYRAVVVVLLDNSKRVVRTWIVPELGGSVSPRLFPSAWPACSTPFPVVRAPHTIPPCGLLNLISGERSPFII